MAGPVKLNELFDEFGPGRQDIDELVKSVSALSRVTKLLAKNLDSDGQRIGVGLANIASQAQTLRERTSSLTLASEAERNAMAALGTQMAELARQQQLQLQSLAGQATIRKAATTADKEAVSALKALQTELKAAYAANDSERITKAAVAIRQYKSDTDQLAKAIRGANSELTASAGSYNRLTIETQQLGERIRALPGGFDATNAAAVRMKKEFADNTQKLKNFDRELNQNFREVGSYARGIIEATQALNGQKAALTGELSALKMQANATHLSAEESRKLRAEIERTETELTKVTGELRSYGAAAGTAGKGSVGLASGAVGMAEGFVGAYLGVTALAGAVASTFENVAEYSDQLADVRKTTNLSREATDDLADSLKTLDTRTSLSGLLDIAAVGGQLGVAGKDIEDFTKSIDVSVQALSDDFKGGAEEIATTVGKINTVFREQLGPDLAENILHIGSAINQLGADGAATAPFLADVALRVGAVAANAGLGLDKLFAYAAVLQEVGFSEEVAGTALNKLLNGLTSKPREYFAIAKLGDANLTLKQFTHLINTDVDAALKLFLKGLNSGGTSTTKFSELVKSLGLKSGAAVSVLTTLAKNTELVAERQATANEQLTVGNSLAQEAALKNNNLAGSWAKLKNDVSNFFTSGTGAESLKYLIDFTRGALNLEKGFGAIPRILGLTKPPIDDLGKSLADAALQARKLADGNDALLARFTRLSGIVKPSVAEQGQLRDVVFQLKNRLGESVVVLNQQTGQYELNTVAVQRNTVASREKFTEEATALAKRLEGLEKERSAANATASAIQEEADARAKAVKDSTTLDPATNARYFEGQLKKQENPTLYGKQFVSDETLRNYTEYVRLTGLASKATDTAVLSEKKRDEVLRQLERIGLDANGALALLTQTTKDDAKATDDSLAADKKKKQAVADLAKEEALLAKQRLEARLADLTRQGENPANSEAVRADALQKAAQIRIQIAKVERDELIHEAALKYKDQIGGEQALGVATVRLTEAFSAKRLGIERETNLALVALHNELLNKLAEVDKLVIETELDALDRTAANDQLSYQERQQAALNASARRIELIQIEADTERRAAKGNAEQLRAIQVKEEKATAAELLKVRHDNADTLNEELEKGYLAAQVALERSRASGAITERQYTEESRTLDNTYHEQRRVNFEKDATKQKEALEQEKANTKEATEFKLAEEVRLRQLRGEIIQEGLQQVQGFSDAYFTMESDTNQAVFENLQQSKAAEVAVAGDNAELKAQIEEKYRKRELEAKRKQAELDKRQAEFNVILNTAQAVTSVLSTGGGTRYADFGISAGILSAFVVAQGLAQLIAIQNRPLPNYFKGRRGGPAEKAVVAEQGPELMGQPGTFRVVAQQGVTQLAAGDRVYTAPETRDVLRDHELVAGRLVARQQQQDQTTQATALRVVSPGYGTGAAAEARAAYAARHDTDRIVEAAKDIKKAIDSLPQFDWFADELARLRKNGDSFTREVGSRYRNRT